MHKVLIFWTVTQLQLEGMLIISGRRALSLKVVIQRFWHSWNLRRVSWLGFSTLIRGWENCSLSLGKDKGCHVVVVVVVIMMMMMLMLMILRATKIYWAFIMSHTVLWNLDLQSIKAIWKHWLIIPFKSWNLLIGASAILNSGVGRRWLLNFWGWVTVRW